MRTWIGISKVACDSKTSSRSSRPSLALSMSYAMNTIRYAWILTLLPLVAVPTSGSGSEKGSLTCTTTKEYVTTLEYLRAQPDFKIPEEQARILANQVSSGCTGAASRFIRISEVLSRSGVGGKDSVAIGKEFASRTDSQTDAFVSVYRRAFLAEYLDLDLKSSLSLARSLSSEFEGDATEVRTDFEKLVDFCISTKNLDLARPDCATFAARLAREGQAFGGGVSAGYIRLYEFLTSESGPRLTTRDALDLAKQIIKTGPTGIDNFMQAYRYAVSPKGLTLGERDALVFAKNLATPLKR